MHNLPKFLSTKNFLNLQNFVLICFKNDQNLLLDQNFAVT
jgi:hypothetical protein